MDFQYPASFESQAKDDGAGLTGYPATFNKVDSYGTAFAPSAFTKMLAERADQIPILYNHDPAINVGIPEKLATDEVGLAVDAQIFDDGADGTTLSRRLRTGARYGRASASASSRTALPPKMTTSTWPRSSTQRSLTAFGSSPRSSSTRSRSSPSRPTMPRRSRRFARPRPPMLFALCLTIFAKTASPTTNAIWCARSSLRSPRPRRPARPSHAPLVSRDAWMPKIALARYRHLLPEMRNMV